MIEYLDIFMISFPPHANEEFIARNKKEKQVENFP